MKLLISILLTTCFSLHFFHVDAECVPTSDSSSISKLDHGHQHSSSKGEEQSTSNCSQVCGHHFAYNIQFNLDSNAYVPQLMSLKVDFSFNSLFNLQKYLSQEVEPPSNIFA